MRALLMARESLLSLVPTMEAETTKNGEAQGYDMKAMQLRPDLGLPLLG